MQKDLRFRVERYMVKNIYHISDNSQLIMIIEFNDDIQCFLKNKKYILTTVSKRDKEIIYHNYDNTNLDKNKFENSEMFSFYAFLCGISIDFENKKDMIKFKLLFFKG